MNNMSEKNIFNIRFNVASIVLPVLNIITVAVCLLIIDRLSVVSCALNASFCLCFDFLILFFIENNKRVFLIHSLSPYLVCLSVPLCTSLVLLTEINLYPFVCCAAIVFVATLFSAYTDYYISAVFLVALTGYTVFFEAPIQKEVIFCVTLSFISCIMAHYIIKGFSIVYSVLITIVFDIILILITNGFKLQNIDYMYYTIVGTAAVLALVIIRLAYKPVLTADDAELKEHKDLNPKCTFDSNPPEHSAPITETITEIQYIETQDPKLLDEIAQLKNDNLALKQKLQELETSIRNTIFSVSTINLDSAPYIARLKQDAPRLYRHCITVAAMSTEAAELIGCDSETARAIAMYHEAAKILGDNYLEQLGRTYRIPTYITKAIEQLKNKENVNPISRETGIVMLADDISNTVSYLKSNKKEDISLERIIVNTFKVRKEQNILRLAGFSNEEVQLLKLYFNDKGDLYDTTN